MKLPTMIHFDEKYARSLKKKATNVWAKGLRKTAVAENIKIKLSILKLVVASQNFILGEKNTKSRNEFIVYGTQ